MNKNFVCRLQKEKISQSSGKLRHVLGVQLWADLALLFAILTLSACTLSGVSPDGVPVDIVFDTPIEAIEGGVHLEPPDTTWDGYGEAIDVHGDVLVIGASEWNQFGPGSAYVYRHAGGVWPEEAQLMASDRDAFRQEAGQFEGQRFGSSVAVGDGIIAIGAPGNSHPIVGGYAGAVYLYEHDGQNWVETAKLTPEHSGQGNEATELAWLNFSRMRPRSFGALVALDGDTLAVGGDAVTDSVYIYQHNANGWQEQAQIPIPGVPERSLYLTSLALWGDTLALSAFYIPPQPEESQVLTGNVIVYIFERDGSTWQESFQFAPDEGAGDLLSLREMNIGASVALGGTPGRANLLAVGLPGFPDWTGELDARLVGVNAEMPDFPPSNRQSGAVTVFERADNGGWNQSITLKPQGWENPPGPGTVFSAAALPTDEASGALDEAAYFASLVFPGDVFSANPEISFFGATVDVAGDRLAVTAGFANATYVFERRDETWVYQYSIKPGSDGQVWEDYAQVVAISGRTLLLGTPGEFGNSAYVFTLPPTASDP